MGNPFETIEHELERLASSNRPGSRIVYDVTISFGLTLDRDAIVAAICQPWHTPGSETDRFLALLKDQILERIREEELSELLEDLTLDYEEHDRTVTYYHPDGRVADSYRY